MSDFWGDYNRGAMGLPPRDGMFYNMAERAGYDASFNNNNNNNGGGASGGGALVLLAIAIPVVVALAGSAAVSAVLAVPAAWLLVAVTALFTGGHHLSFTDAYRTSFVGLMISNVVGMVVVIAALEGWLPFMAHVSVAAYLIAGEIDAGSLSTADMISVGLGVAILLLPGLAAFAIVLGRRIGNPYTGLLGFLRGLVASIAVLLVPMILLGAATWFVATYGEIALNENEIVDYLLVVLGLVTAMALAGGLLLGLLLMAFGGGLTRGGPMLRSAWFSGAVAMAIAGGTLALAVVFFRDADAMLQWLIALAGRYRSEPPLFMTALPGFLKLSLPGALAGAMFVAGNLYAYRGIGGFAKAVIITVPTCFLVFGGTMMLVAQLR